jgi:hypothetical protein
MWRDPIVEEVRRVREAYAAKFDFDLHAICEDLRARQKQFAGRVVSRAPQLPVLPLKKSPSMPDERGQTLTNLARSR